MSVKFPLIDKNFRTNDSLYFGLPKQIASNYSSSARLISPGDLRPGITTTGFVVKMVL